MPKSRTTPATPQPANATDKSNLKRGRASRGEQPEETKKPRRSTRISTQHGEGVHGNQQLLPSPVTHATSTSVRKSKETTAEPPESSQLHNLNDCPHTPPASTGLTFAHGLRSPTNDTQMFSQSMSQFRGNGFSHQVKDEEAEGVWGYLLPLDDAFGDVLVLRRRTACPMDQGDVEPGDGKKTVSKDEYEKQEEKFEEKKINGTAAGGYLLGRHPECDRVISVPTVSNRHCLIFNETKSGKDIAVLEDLSGNGTFVNQTIVGRNKRRQLYDRDEIAILDQARFVFRYSRTRTGHGFAQQYSIETQLGKGHFATVYLCIERNSGMKFAVKKFEKRTGPGEKSRVEGLEQEIAVLMGISHPNLLCLKDVFDEDDGAYLVLELAVEGELFNWIVRKSKLSESESRKIFIQLFQGLKYLHERNIVHRDIKPENILLVDSEGSIKVADFGLAKIIGEESFTTTLCGTPSYVAPEILESSNHRRYTRAVDVWSAGVVLYICLCGFPPFSDELYSRENPYTLSQQIKLGRFDYPSPYWDPVSDLALDLIDRMLTVDVERRITIDECLEHPWITGQDPTSFMAGLGPNGGGPSFQSTTSSTEGLSSALNRLDFSKRKPHRERTLLSSLNDIKIVRTVDVNNKKDDKVKIWSKTNEQGHDDDEDAAASPRDKAGKKDAKAGGKKAGNGVGNGHKHAGHRQQPLPDRERAPEDFTQMGGVGDQPLFANDPSNRYAPKEAERKVEKVIDERNGDA